MAKNDGEKDGARAQRPATWDDIIAPSAKRDVRRLPKLVVEAFGLVRRAAARELRLAATMQIVAGLSLAAQLLVARALLARIATEGSFGVGEIVPHLVLLGVLLVIVAATGVLQREQQRVLAEEVERYTSGRVMDVAMHTDLIDFDRPSFFDRLQRARTNASARPLQIATGVIGLLGSGTAVLAVGATLLIVEPVVAVIILFGSLPALYFNRLSSRALHRYAVAQTAGDRRRAYLYLTLTRKDEAHEVRAFDSGSYLRDEHDRLFAERIAATRGLARRRVLYGTLSGSVVAAVTIVSLTVLLVFVQIGRLDLADAAVSVGAVVIVASRIRALVSSSGSLYEGALFLTDFTDFVEHGRRQLARARDGVPVPPFREISLDDVSFTYPSRQEPSLRNISLELRRGEVIALVGENGSGKTTLTKLLAGLYQPTDGEVRWSGVDATELDPAGLRDQVAVIFQDFARYFLTAHENIAISRIAAMAEGPAVHEAARKAGADGFVSALPDGYQTLLGPSFVGGSDLSLGQWQRIALARAYFRDAPLLILDEPTASLDPRGELEIFQQVRKLAAERTVVLVSHRFSSVRVADRILVLDGGRIVEEGSHAQLVASGGLYAELFEIQAAGYQARYGEEV